MKTDIDNIPNLYSITGNILDINTVLINREELRKLIEAKKDLLEALKADIDPSWECNSRHPKMYVMFTKYED